MCHGEVNKFLIVWVFADDWSLGSNLHRLDQPVKLTHHIVRLKLVILQSFDDLGIGQHPLQLLTHGRGGDPLQVARLQAVPQWLGGGVVEDEGVQDDVGVEDDSLRLK